jgi:hypothetical protein
MDAEIRLLLGGADGAVCWTLSRGEDCERALFVSWFLSLPKAASAFDWNDVRDVRKGAWNALEF